MAPEIHAPFKCGFLGKPADMFAVAVIFFIMVFGAPPFDTSENIPNSLYNKVVL